MSKSFNKRTYQKFWQLRLINNNGVQLTEGTSGHTYILFFLLSVKQVLCVWQCGGKNIRFVVMNNLLPSSVQMHEKYDLKGSTYKRKASRKEKQKKSPTLKDLDFLENHPEGIMLEAETYSALINTISRDCRVSCKMHH